jgi:hypothetical protein
LLTFVDPSLGIEAAALPRCQAEKREDYLLASGPPLRIGLGDQRQDPLQRRFAGLSGEPSHAQDARRRDALSLDVGEF